MIVEGILTTIDADGRVNLAPMGPILGADRRRLTLRPFTTSHTYRNLKAHGEAVFHATDDAELIARAAVGEAVAPLRPAVVVRGFALADACTAHELRVVSIDDASERAVIETEIVHTTRGRDWLGHNRARHAVVEAAIVATRVHLLPAAEVDRQLEALWPLVDKTGGAPEQRAFQFLLEHVAAARREREREAARVVTGSRLHFGLLSPWSSGSRRFGGAGLMVDRPGIDLLARPAPEWSADGPLAARALSLARRLVPGPGFAARIEVRTAPSEHSGLGVGTQLALAVARALSALRGEAPTVVELARHVGRGLRSAIGVHGFEHGGFLVDGGRREGDEAVAPLLLRAAVPEEWRFVLAIPRNELGRHGPAEEVSFREAPTVAAGLSERLAHRLLLGLAPAMAERDARAFGEALTDYNRLAGELFANVQGSVYASPRVARLVSDLRAAGVVGVAQSSWGPAVVALAEDDERARWIEGLLRSDGSADDLDLRIARPLNRGARLEKGLPSATVTGTIVAP